MPGSKAVLVFVKDRLAPAFEAILKQGLQDSEASFGEIDGAVVFRFSRRAGFVEQNKAAVLERWYRGLGSDDVLE